MLSFSASEFRILIVDDSIDNLRFLANILTQQGYQVRKVLNGHMALTAAKASPPDLVVLDINMPQMNGYEVCQALKAEPLTAHIPVIFISALDDVLDRVRAYTVGGVDYIAKPFQFEEVVARVGTQLRLQFASRELGKTIEQSDRAATEYQTLFEHLDQGAYQVNLDGTYRRVNPALAELLGYPSAMVLLEHLSNAPQALYVDAEDWLTLVEQLTEQQPILNKVATVRREDGSAIAWSESLYPVGGFHQPEYYLGLVKLVS